MTQFQYVATKKNGEMVKGQVDGDDQKSALEAVKKLGLHPLSVHPAKKGTGFLSISIGSKVKVKDLVIFTRQMATLVNAGVPIVRSLSTLQQQTESQLLKKQLGVIVKKLRPDPLWEIHLRCIQKHSPQFT